MHEITCILCAIEKGDPQATEELFPLVYNDLRRLAAEKLAREKPGQILQATALVHEAYIRLVDGKVARHWQSRTHFFKNAAEAMRRILVDQARRKRRLKRGGAMDRIEFSRDCALSGRSRLDLLALDEALGRLAERDPVGAELVKLRFFAGMTMCEAADALGVSLATVERDWTFAKAWLFVELSDHSATPTLENRESP